MLSSHFSASQWRSSISTRSKSSRRISSNPVRDTSGGTGSGIPTAVSIIRRPWIRARKSSGGKRSGRDGSRLRLSNGTKRTGIGVGAHGNADIGEDASEAHVRLHPDGTADALLLPQSEHGTGQTTNLLKMVAETLQVPMERVSLSPPDSLINPYEFGPAGSRGTYAIGQPRYPGSGGCTAEAV